MTATFGWHNHVSTTLSPWRHAPVALAALLVAQATIASVHLLVLNPLAAVPGVGLSEIYAGVRSEGESMGAVGVLACLALPVLLGVAVLALRGRRVVDDRLAVGVLLGLVAWAGVAGWFASIGPSMALADAYGLSGAPYDQWWMLPAALSAVALVTLVAREVRWLASGSTR